MTLSDHPVWALAVVMLGAAATAAATYAIAVAPSRTGSGLGARGFKRQLVIAKGGLFALLEPLLRWCGSRLSGLVPDRTWRSIDRRLVRSGDDLGITPEEYIVLLALGIAAGAAAGCIRVTEYGIASPALGCAVGGLLVRSYFDGRIERRLEQMTHGLPYVTDLLALALTAGLDFSGAVRSVVERASDRRDALTEEMERMLRELGLGNTRRVVLEGLAERVQVPAITEFVHAVVQAEERGTPLVQVFTTQAKVGRQKRVTLAEERTSRAAVAMALPLALLSTSVTIVLGAPVVLKIMGSMGNLS